MTQIATKMAPCCAKFQSMIGSEKANLRRLAQKAALADQKNRDISKLKAAMDRTRTLIAEAERNQVEHEADHAAEGAA